MTRRQRLQAILDRAEADLQRAVTLSVAAGADRFLASEAIDKARATCRQARAALTELDHTEGR